MSVLFIVASLAASAADPSATVAATGAQAAPTPAKERKICRDEAETGSLIPKRTCHSKAEWDAIANAGQNDVNAIRNRPMQSWVKGG